MEGLSLLITIIVLGLCLVALFAVLEVLFPRRVERTRQAADAMPGRAFLIGLVNFIFLAALVMGFSALGQNLGVPLFFLPALIFLVLLSIGLVFGLAGVVELAGERLFPEREALQRTVWGTSALYLACLTPFVGWFGLLIYVGLLGLGAFVVGFFQRPRPVDQEPQPE